MHLPDCCFPSCQELKAQLEADNPKPAVSSKAARAAPPPAASLTSASAGPDCQSGADAVLQSSGYAEESAAANAPAAAKAAGTAAKVCHLKDTATLLLWVPACKLQC